MENNGFEQLKAQVDLWLREAEKAIQQIPKTQLFMGFGLILLTTLIPFIVNLCRRSKANTVVLIGLSGSGKTVLFYQKRKIKAIDIIDVPGHSRIRGKVDEYLPKTAGIVFVVDALEFLPHCRAASEYLYDILTKAIVVQKRIPVLILCNKVDKVSAHTKEFICKQLEKEIDKLRASRTTVSEADIDNECSLGIPGKPFSFSQYKNKVAVAEASGSKGEISQLEEFIRENVKV